MTTIVRLGGVSALALLLGATASLAQTRITGINDLNDRLDDIEEVATDVIDDAEDEMRFGNPEFQPGLSGSASLSYSGIEGTTDQQDFTAGARLRYAQGPFVQTMGVAIDYSEDEDSSTREDIFAVYDGNYYFNDQLYAFILGRGESNGLADEADEVLTDAFIGVGPGYRIINTPNTTWRVQAGVGISYLEDGLENSETDTGYIASSRFYYAFSENVFVTNDTDVLNSDAALRINNDLGVSFRMSDAFTTRVSYLIDYNDERAERTDNQVQLSLVYGF